MKIQTPQQQIELVNKMGGCEFLNIYKISSNHGCDIDRHILDEDILSVKDCPYTKNNNPHYVLKERDIVIWNGGIHLVWGWAGQIVGRSGFDTVYIRMENI